MMDYSISEQRIMEFKNYLHRIPELHKDLPKTRAYLVSVLEKLPCEIIDIGEDGFAVFFPGIACKGQCTTLAFRSDMDALPIEEAEGSLGRSEHPGKMHACGHDGHMSILLGLAFWLAEHKGSISTNCLLIFQAAEETTGGAMGIAGSGILGDYSVDAIFGLHLWPGHPFGTIVCRQNEFMAGTFVLSVDISGKAVHIANYSQGIDALAAGASFIERAYKLEQSLSDDVYRLLRFGKMTSGTGDNVISDKSLIVGAVRAYDDAIFDYLFDGLESIAGDISEETGCTFSMSRSMGYPPLINPEPLYGRTKEVLTAAGFEWIAPERPIMQAEDFSYYQKEVPGLYLHLGTGLSCKLHSSDYRIDDKILMKGVSLFSEIVKSYE